MIQKPLIEYIQKIVEYKANNYCVATKWYRVEIYAMKYELIKGCYGNGYSYYINDDKIKIKLFQRYMNNSNWKW